MIPAGTTYDPEKVVAFFVKLGCAKPVFEYAFHPLRDWRFDLAWPSKKIALEVHGGLYTGGRHNTPEGFLKDMEKENAANLMGWHVFKTTPRFLCSFGTVAMIKQAISA